jgi:hypothetical protein
MSIILPEKAVQTLLTNKIQVFNAAVPLNMNEMFSSSLYGQTNINDWINYYSDHQIKVKLGWPNEETEVPTLYVAASDAVHDETTIGPADRYVLSSDNYATEDMHIYSKGTKVIAAADNYNIALTMAAIAEYFIHQNSPWFEDFGMSTPKINFQEFDFASQFWPQKLHYRSFIVTFMVVDAIIVSKDDTIKGINVDLTSW